MARMSIDDKILRDPRVLRLAKLCGWNKYEAIGHLLDVWSVCYDRVSEFADPVEVDLTAGLDGFSEHLIACGLAVECTKQPTGSARRVRVSGVKQRIEYLSNSAKAGRKGGIKSGESRRNSSKRPFKQTGSDPPGSTNLNTIVPDTASAVVLVPDPPPPDPLTLINPESPAKPDPKPGKAATVIAHWNRRFANAGLGKADWTPAVVRELDSLLGRQSLEEVIRHIDNAFDAPPDWPKPPYVFVDIARNFNKFVGRRSASGATRPATTWFKPKRDAT